MPQEVSGWNVPPPRATTREDVNIQNGTNCSMRNRVFARCAATAALLSSYGGLSSSLLSEARFVELASCSIQSVSGFSVFAVHNVVTEEDEEDAEGEHSSPFVTEDAEQDASPVPTALDPGDGSTSTGVGMCVTSPPKGDGSTSTGVGMCVTSPVPAALDPPAGDGSTSTGVGMCVTSPHSAVGDTPSIVAGRGQVLPSISTGGSPVFDVVAGRPFYVCEKMKRI